MAGVMLRPLTIISGGQTGGDQGGLEGAREAGIQTGGYCPANCRTEEGDRPELIKRYGLKATPQSSYPPRTRLNVRSSDGTAWFGRIDTPGYVCTRNACLRYGKPFRVINSADVNIAAQALRCFMRDHLIRCLNVAGNRESTNPGLCAHVREVIVTAFTVQGELS